MALYVSARAYAAETPPGSFAPVDTAVRTELREVVVSGTGARQRIGNAVLGAERLDLSRLTRLPAFGGEADLIKSITLLPGVHSEGEGAGGYEVRGGNASQNLVQLDGMTLYNPTHVMGVFSTFNDAALGGATLFKGPVPVMYGGATSSVLDASLAAGDMEHYHGSATIGILAAKIKAEGPIVKDRLSFAVAARRSYVDAFLKMVPQYRSTVLNFYDVTAKLRFRPSERHTVDGSFFAGRDNMAVGDIMGMYWGNVAGSVNWAAHASDRLSFITTAALTHFAPKMEMDIMDAGQQMRTFIHNYSVNERVRYAIDENHALEAGVRSGLLKVKSAEWTQNDVREKEVRSLWENSAWIGYTGSYSARVEVDLGVRLNLSVIPAGNGFHEFETVWDAGNEFDAKTYFSALPHAGVKYRLGEHHNIKAAFGMSEQNLHAIRSGTTTFPFDRYALASAAVKPERATQYGLGYTGMTASGDFDWSAESYYRHISDVYDYRDGRGAFSHIALESIILGGRGRSYGLELMLRKNAGRLTGWVAYTLSRTETKIPGINAGRWYDASNDRRHDVSVTAFYSLSDKWDLSASWIYSSGQPLTVPDVKYEIAGETCYYYSQRNAYRTPATHRLDLSATYTRTGRKFTYRWAFGIYNAYCRYNPFVVYFEDDPSKPSGTRAVQQSMYGLVPSVSYTLKF